MPAQINEELIHILHYNIRGWTSHNAELASMIRLLDHKPLLVCLNLNETFLDKGSGDIELEGYVLLGQRDRCDGRA